MQINILTRDDCLKFLKDNNFGRIACARDTQPYVTQIYFVYHEPSIYCFSALGRKIEWLRSNPQACLTVDSVGSAQRWTSVVVFGRYEELSAKDAESSSHDNAYNLLRGRHLWWEPGYVKSTLKTDLSTFEPVYFRLSVDEISGRQAMP
jgi:nitroimidazol reductase NimA-like FMN-containing flavoprotein (pyridoxamine 5'-phosphate oxidase superfamily)